MPTPAPPGLSSKMQKWLYIALSTLPVKFEEIQLSTSNVTEMDKTSENTACK